LVGAQRVKGGSRKGPPFIAPASPAACLSTVHLRATSGRQLSTSAEPWAVESVLHLNRYLRERSISMTFSTKLLAGAAGLAAIAASAPAAAQYYGSPAYSNGYPYGNAYGYNQYNQYNGYNAYGANTNAAAQQCSAAVQSRLYNRNSIGGILGAVLGANTTGRVVSITQVNPRQNGMVRVRGLASSGRVAYNNGYGPYGVGTYGSLGYGYANAADLSFRCDVAPNGAVYSVSINRR
jgi:hypothetical protein